MLTLKQIFQATSDSIKDRARFQCFGQIFSLPRNKKLRESATRSGGYVVEDESGKYREFKFRVKCTDGWRKVGLRFYGPINMGTKVWCWCSCPYFKYHCEVALSEKGSSSIVQSNGQRPRFTNPTMEPRCCKHVFLGFALAMRRRKPGQDLVMGALTQRGGRVKQRMNPDKVWGGDRPPRGGDS